MRSLQPLAALAVAIVVVAPPLADGGGYASTLPAHNVVSAGSPQLIDGGDASTLHDAAGSPQLIDDEWYVCTGVSTVPAAPWNGTASQPFLGSFPNASGCQAACEAIPSCTAFSFGGSTPHVGPTGKNWHNRCCEHTSHHKLDFEFQDCP